MAGLSVSLWYSYQKSELVVCFTDMWNYF